MSNRKAVIFTGGSGPNFKKVKDILKNSEIIVAADSGWDLAAGMGIEPDYYIGDMDSLRDHEGLGKIEENRIKKFPPEKDYTDTELAIKFIEDKDFRDIVLIGGGGGRIDHLMAIISIFNRKTKPSEWYTAYERIIYAEKECDIKCSPGQTVSVFSCGRSDAVICSEGLKWELNNFQINPGQFSISNVALREEVSFRILTGSVFIIINY